MPLPADTIAERVDDITSYRKDSVQQIDDLLCVQAVDQVGGHQTPDRAAGADVDARPADEVDQQRRSEHGYEIDEQVSPSADPVLEHESIYHQRVHIADEMQPVSVQETAQDQTEVLAPLECTLRHPVMVYDVKFAAGQFIQTAGSVQEDQDQGYPGDTNRMFSDMDPTGCFFF